MLVEAADVIPTVVSEHHLWSDRRHPDSHLLGTVSFRREDKSLDVDTARVKEAALESVFSRHGIWAQPHIQTDVPALDLNQ